MISIGKTYIHVLLKKILYDLIGVKDYVQHVRTIHYN
jgi:hypothetical protein